MYMKKICTTVSIICALFFFSCANRLYKKGVKNYEVTNYAKAIDCFEKYLNKGSNEDAIIKLADSYRLTNNLANAERWYAKVVLSFDCMPINFFYYGKILMSLEKYDEAKIWFNKYLQKVPDDFVAEMLLASCYSINSFKADTTLYSLSEIEMPDVATSFGVTPYKEGIVFTADKLVFKNSKKYGWTGRSYLDLYFSQKDRNGKWISPVLLKGNINGQYHEGPACFTKDGNTVYFTRSNISGKKIKKNSKNENDLKIYSAELVNNNWTNVKELPFNSDDYSCGHPCLSSDEKILYFISDMPGGYGGTDIYKSIFDGNTWSKPENLGSVINTSGNEMFPYMHSDGSFYFSSDSHHNLGGLDVFVTSYDGNKWLQAENLNYPLNSSKDDFGYTLNPDNKTGYISSNRSNEDKIYEVTKNDPTFILSGIVKQKGSAVLIDSAVIELVNINTREKEFVFSDNDGQYKVKLKPQCAYLIRASKLMYFTVSSPLQLSTVGKKISENFSANFVLDQIIIEKPIALENIYYDLDKWNIRPDAEAELNKVVQVMEDNPKIHIELSSHTDSRAGDQYNLILSDKRAKAAVEYIISKGVDAKRMKWKGYGETRLVNKCKNGVPCTEEEHQQNRRTEFKVIKIDKDVMSSSK